jgi:ribonuclease HI
VAKYEALVIGLRMTIKWKIKTLHVYGDSQLVINQVNDDYDTKDEKLMPYKRMVDSFQAYFHMVTFEQIP